MRGIAAFLIISFHFTDYYTAWFDRKDPALFHLPMGKFGVHLFFIISGFVIFMTLEKTKRPLDFVVSRFSRLFPAYWVAIVLTFTAVHVFGLESRGVALKTAFMNLTMLQSWLGYSHVDGVYWTLTPEIFFYAVMFVLLITKQLKNVESWGLAWMSLIVLSDGMFDIHWPKFVVISRMLEFSQLFFAGILFYNLKTKGRPWWRHAAILICLAVQYVLRHDPLITPTVAVYFGLFYLFVFDRLRWIARRPLVFLGTISYSFYLIHQNIGYIIINRLYDAGAPAWVRYVVPLGCTMLLATALAFLVERPAMGWIRKKYFAMNPLPKP